MEPDAFNAYERQAWNTVADAYIAGFGPLTQQAIPALLDAVEPIAGATFLDLACGPGWLSAEAARRGAVVTGLDAAEVMVTEARKRFPDLRFEMGSAETLPFPAAQFDVVGCNYGMLHFGRPEIALREMQRVLRPGGRVGFTVWAPPDQTIAYRIVLGAIQTHGRQDVGLPPGPPFFRFAEADAAASALLEAGFVEPMSQLVPQQWRLESAEELFDVMCRGTGRTRGLLLGQSIEARETIRAAIIEGARPYVGECGLELAMPAVLSIARIPA